MSYIFQADVQEPPTEQDLKHGCHLPHVAYGLRLHFNLTYPGGYYLTVAPYCPKPRLAAV